MREWITHHTRDLIIGIRGLNGHVGIDISGFMRFLGGFGIGGTNHEGGIEFYDARHLSTANTWFLKAGKKEITYGSG